LQSDSENESNTTQRGVRVAEGARLESVYTREGIEGSNPSLSAAKPISEMRLAFVFIIEF
jgi:hypothetical protein